MRTCCDILLCSGLDGRELIIHLDNEFPDFGCEYQTCSPYSPGPVEDEEEIAFLLIDPLHYDPVRKVVVPDAFQELTNRDLSVLRLRYANKQEAKDTQRELVARGAARKVPQDRAVNEVCTGLVSDIRENDPNTGRRLVGVLDTALCDKPSHASIITNADALKDKKQRKILREHVHRVMTRSIRTFECVLDLLPD